MATERPEQALRSLEERGRQKTGMGTMDWITIATIGASVTLFLLGKKNLGIFIGLWPPTLQALKNRM